jgi:hypothetical protein
MQCVIGALASLHSCDERRLLEKIAVLDAFVYARQVLIDDAPGAHRDMAHFGVSHLPVRQPHLFARCLKR